MKQQSACPECRAKNMHVVNDDAGLLKCQACRQFFTTNADGSLNAYDAPRTAAEFHTKRGTMQAVAMVAAADDVFLDSKRNLSEIQQLAWPKGA